jgi:chromosomal replication initiator protein
MQNKTPQEIWEAALGDIQVQVSKPNYRTWFNKTVGLSYEDNQFVIGVSNTFIAEYLDKNQRSLIEKALIGFTSNSVQAVFQVNGKSHNHKGACDGEQRVSFAAQSSQSSLKQNYVFDYFIEGSGNRLARAAALSVAQNPGRSYNPLFIYGGAGLGKTHLLHAIGHAAIANHTNVICISAEQFTNEFLTALREKNTEAFRNKFRSIGILLIDDIQFISGKAQTQESFFHTFNELHNTNRQIIVTSDCPPKSIPSLEDRLRSRFEWGLIVDVQPPDAETRLAILQSKVQQKGLNIGLDVLELIAKRAQQNIRELEGSLNRVVAFSKLFQTAPTTELAAKALEDIGSKKQTPTSITPDAILEAVASCFQLTREDLKGRKRDKETALARRVAMYLIRQETNYTLTQIAGVLGNRDAAAVTNACKKLAEDVQSNVYLKRKLQDIQRSLASSPSERR